MLDRYDATELLALIEGELDAPAAASLRRRLASDPTAAAQVEAMIRDRAALRAMEEPALPTDFIAAIEPMLSRPMLMEPVIEPAAINAREFRRRHRRRTAPLRWGRLAAAAAVLLTTIAGTWVVAVNWNTLRGLVAPPGSLIASNGSPASNPLAPANTGAPASAIMTSAATTDAPLGTGPVHHDLRPGALAETRPMAQRSINPRSAEPSTPPSVITADFALVVHASPTLPVEQRVVAMVGALDTSTAIVRNFSFAEAQRLADEYRLAHGGMRSGADATGDRAASTITSGTVGAADASLSRSELQQLASQVRQQMRARASTDTAAGSTQGSTLLAGPQALAPTLEQQLEFSSRGATHTIAVPASHLAALLEQLALTDPALGSTSLRMLAHIGKGQERADAAASQSDAVLAWMTEGPMIRAAIHRLTHGRSDAIVLLPIIIR